MILNTENYEESFIGNLMYYSDEKNTYGIKPSHIKNIELRKIFEVIVSIIDKGGEPNIINVKNELEERSELDFIGGNLKIVELVNLSTSSVDLKYLSDKIKEKNVRLDAYDIGEKIKMVVSSGAPLSNLYNMTKELVTITNIGDNKYDLAKDIDETKEILESRRGKELFGPSMNNYLVDKYCKGIQEARTYRIGAVSNLGKSWLMYNIVNTLIDQGKKVIFFTLENDKSMTITNLLANRMGINPDKIGNMEVVPEFDILSKYKENLFIIDDVWDLGEIFSRTLQIKPDIVCLDFIGLIEIKGKNGTEAFEEYAKQVQHFVKTERLSWIDLSNLEAKISEDDIRMHGHFFGSSYLRNLADVGIHMWYYAPYYKWKKDILDNPFLSKEDKEQFIFTQVIQMELTKNRLGPKSYKVYKIEFNNGGRYVEATDEEITKWNS